MLHLPDSSTLSLDHPLIMGILNVTPDSFSDGGLHSSVETAVAHAMAMVEEGADIIDVGGGIHAAGVGAVGADEQVARVAPVIERLVARLGESRRAGSGGRRVVVSIDTTLCPVARAALDAGAGIINDVSAARDDPGMLALAAGRGAPLVLMHMQGTPETMQRNPAYQDVAAEVRAFLLDRAEAAIAAGVPRGQVILDPGIGFGKAKEHNLTLLAHLEGLAAAGHPVLLGASRKRFMGSICGSGQSNAEPPAPADLVGATCATTALGVAAGVRIFRVHDVRANRQAADVAWAVKQRR